MEVCSKSGKNCYTRHEAGLLLNLAKRRHKNHSKKIPKRCYFCKYCNTYHLTSIPKWFGKSNRKKRFYGELKVKE